MLELEDDAAVEALGKAIANKCKVLGTTDHVLLLMKTIIRETEALLVRVETS
tara:strand:- start:20 stop:175 length:156 start_codon:yes stop_codon:yes gene_type:complete